MENEKSYSDNKVIDLLAEKKISDWSCKRDNFAMPHELTVTVTLEEYRELVGAKAVSDFRSRNEIDALKSEIKVLKDENEMLTQKIMRMEQPQHEPKSAE